MGVLATWPRASICGVQAENKAAMDNSATAREKENDMSIRNCAARFYAWFSQGDTRHAYAVYTILAGHSRNPFFYARCGVPDTPRGQMEILHLLLLPLVEKVKGAAGSPAWRFVQEVVEAHFAHLDILLREQGIGDTGVSRRVKAAAGYFYARMEEYQAGGAVRREAILRYVYGGGGDADGITALCDTLHALQDALDALPVEEITDAEKLAAVYSETFSCGSPAATGV